LVPPKWITIGGGNEHGAFTYASISNLIRDMHMIGTAGYEGIVFDIECVWGVDSLLILLFKAAFV
jgi:hypothetical protein